MIEKDTRDAKIRKGLSARRGIDSFQTQTEIIIPAGTMLRAIGDDKYAAAVGFGKGGFAGTFTVEVKPGSIDAVTLAPVLKRVIAS